MNAPSKVRIGQVQRLIADYIEQRCRLDQCDGLRCAACDLTIRFATAHLSVHFDGFECSGPGVVTTRPLPYCMACEGMPNEIGCVHVDPTTFRLPKEAAA